MGAAGYVVAEERLVGGNVVELLEPADCFIRHRRGQVPAWLVNVRRDGRGIAKQVGLPLARVAADETVEILEAHPRRPQVKRPDLAGLKLRRIVGLAEPGSAVAVLLENFADRGCVLGDDAVVAREAGGLLGDDSKADGVMIATGDQRGARRRAECCRMELRVAQSHLRYAIERRRGDHAAKGARGAKAHVVGHDQQHIRRALGRHDPRRPKRLRLRGIQIDHAAEGRSGRWQIAAIDRFGRVRRAGYYGGRRRFGIRRSIRRGGENGGHERPRHCEATIPHAGPSRDGHSST